MIPVDGSFILSVAPRFSGAKAKAQNRIVEAISDTFSTTLDKYQINTTLRIAHFMGQVTHECAGFRTTEEFASGSAYENRKDLGNIKKGDGKRYKGRGLIQLTGRANYKRIGDILDLPLEDQPELAAEPSISLDIACEYWKDRNINDAADRDDLVKATKLINGGLNGLDDRRKYLYRAKDALAHLEGIRLSYSQGGTTKVIRRGSCGHAVGELQDLLIKNGYNITIDNAFGPATELAVSMFQKKCGLAVDCIVGQDTWVALRQPA